MAEEVSPADITNGTDEEWILSDRHIDPGSLLANAAARLDQAAKLANHLRRAMCDDPSLADAAVHAALLAEDAAEDALNIIGQQHRRVLPDVWAEGFARCESVDEILARLTDGQGDRGTQ